MVATLKLDAEGDKLLVYTEDERFTAIIEEAKGRWLKRRKCWAVPVSIKRRRPLRKLLAMAEWEITPQAQALLDMLGERARNAERTAQETGPVSGVAGELLTAQRQAIRVLADARPMVNVSSARRGAIATALLEMSPVSLSIESERTERGWRARASRAYSSVYGDANGSSEAEARGRALIELARAIVDAPS